MIVRSIWVVIICNNCTTVIGVGIPLWYMLCSSNHGFILLCWLHVKKASIDNLLPKVVVVERHKVYQCTCQLMHSCIEFNVSMLCELMAEYKEKRCLWRMGRKHCVWRNLWPRFGRLFAYGHIEIWHYQPCGETLAIYKIHSLERKN